MSPDTQGFRSHSVALRLWVVVFNAAVLAGFVSTATLQDLPDSSQWGLSILCTAGVVMISLASYITGQKGSEASKAVRHTVYPNDAFIYAPVLLGGLVLPVVPVVVALFVSDVVLSRAARQKQGDRRAVTQAVEFNPNPLYKAVTSSSLHSVMAFAAALVLHLLGSDGVSGEVSNATVAGMMVALVAAFLLHNAAFILLPLLDEGVSVLPGIVRSVFSSESLLVDATLGLLAIPLALTWSETELGGVLMMPVLYLVQRSILHNALVQASRTDAKTGLCNAEHWRVVAERHVTRATTPGRESQLSVLVVDLDHFKRVNDTLGHLAGDDVLKEVATRLRSSVRPGDLVGRFGGEEFVILLPDALGVDAVRVAERCRLAVSGSSISTVAGDVDVTASVGVSSIDGTVKVLADMMSAADEALYAAKSQGRDRVVEARSLVEP